MDAEGMTDPEGSVTVPETLELGATWDHADTTTATKQNANFMDNSRLSTESYHPLMAKA